MKKIFVCFLATLMFMICSISLVGCDNGEEVKEQKVMTLSLNPKVEFILDADDKVVSVNALNEEGNLIVTAESFIGKTAEESASLFVKITKETGFLVSGNVNDGENKLQISFSGDSKKAEELYNSVKAKVNEYFTEENVTATIEKASAITKEQLQALVKECEPYLEEAKIKAMEHNELVDMLKKSREETAEFYSQELKKAYYEAKAFCMQKAELLAVRIEDGPATMAFTVAFKTYEKILDDIEESRATVLLKEHGPYQVLLIAFRQAKVAFLNYRTYVASLEQNEITEQISARLETLKTAVETAETKVIEKANELNSSYDAVKEEIKIYYDAVVETLEDYSNKKIQYASAITSQQKTEYEDFYISFKITYTTEIAKAKVNWKNMRNQLIQGQTK